MRYEMGLPLKKFSKFLIGSKFERKNILNCDPVMEQSFKV